MREGTLNQRTFKQKLKRVKKVCHKAYLSKNLFRLKLSIFHVYHYICTTLLILEAVKTYIFTICWEDPSSLPQRISAPRQDSHENLRDQKRNDTCVLL